MDDKSKQFLELLEDAREVFSQDNLDIHPEHVDLIVSTIQNDMWDDVLAEENAKLRKRNRALERIKRQRLYQERVEKLEDLAQIHIEKLNECKDKDITVSLEEFKNLQQEIIDVLDGDLND